MDKLRLRLMHRAAVEWLSDACLLKEADPLCLRQYDSYPFLRLLALELLLKFMYEIEHNKSAKAFNHNYQILFSELRQDTQEKLIALCGEQMGPTAFTKDHKKILEEWGTNFVKLRYPYELYKNMSVDQYKARSDRWIKKGGPSESACLRVFPDELTGVLYALQTLANQHAKQLFGEDYVHDVFK